MQRLFFAAACRAAAMKSTQRVGEVLLCNMKFAGANEVPNGMRGLRFI